MGQYDSKFVILLWEHIDPPSDVWKIIRYAGSLAELDVTSSFNQHNAPVDEVPRSDYFANPVCAVRLFDEDQDRTCDGGVFRFHGTGTGGGTP